MGLLAYIAVVGSGLVACFLLLTILRIIRYTIASKAAVKVTHRFRRESPGSNKHILVLGDSTMYGAGIKMPSNTIGGLLASEYGDASIETLAVNGATVGTLESQLRRACHDHYDLIVIGIGGNDIVRFSSFDNVARRLEEILRLASDRAERIVLCHSVNIGNTGFFLFPLNHLYDRRSRKLSEVFGSVAQKFEHVRYVNFYRPMALDFYDRHSRGKFLAADGFHPNDYANRFFFNFIRDALKSE